MSGIVGFMNLNREPANPELLSRLCRLLENRAPDGVNIWHQGNVGLGHALLVTSPEDSNSSQPVTTDGKAWVTADAHIYGKSELVQRLLTAGVRASTETPVPHLLLTAYREFGEDFVGNLVGDFALAVWDSELQKLLCIRDHLGVRPLFYACNEDTFVFASDIDVVLAHPAVKDELDDNHISDLLLLGCQTEPDTTVYKHIKRIPAAHYLKVDASGFKLQKYWAPSNRHTIRYSDSSEYTEHFNSLFEQAVAERLPSDRVALELSGGMDSSSIAAVAAKIARQSNLQITAYTNTCHQLIPSDEEGQIANIIADRLNIPIHFLASEDYPLFDRFDSEILSTSEPYGNPDLAQHYDKLRQMLDSGTRVLLTGQMGDTLFAGSASFLPGLIKSGHWIRFLSELAAHHKSVGSLKGTGLRSLARKKIRKSLGKKSWQPDMPNWLNTKFAERVGSKNRWQTIWQMWSDLNDLHGQLQRPWFSQLFENYEVLKLPLVVRHPYSDIRLVDFMMRLPNYMLLNKRLMREAMQNKLPTEVVSRPKKGLPGDLRKAKMKKGLGGQIPSLLAADEYIDKDSYLSARKQFLLDDSEKGTWGTWLMNYPIALAFWMNNNKN